jgi:hypothetical protein
MRTRALLLALFVLSSGMVHAYASDPVLPNPDHLIDIMDADCSSLDTLAPEYHEVPVVGDYTTPVDLRVHVLAVQTPPEVAAQIMARVKTLYEPLAIRVIPTIEVVDMQVEIPPDTSATAPVLSASHSQAFIDASKERFGGVRPPTADVVYTMLGGELASSVAGQADCVGGIAHDDAAFSVGEATWETDRAIHRSAGIAGHEIAHLLAAHHHYANCAEGDPDDAVAYLKPCTLMINDVGLLSLKFSTLEGAVVRRWALDYLGPNPKKTPEPGPAPEPQPEPQPEPDPGPQTFTRSVTLAPGDESLDGTVTSEPEADFCTEDALVKLQRKRDGKWRTIATATTDDLSSFTFPVTRAGTFRAKAVVLEFDDGDVCSEALSPKVKVG